MTRTAFVTGGTGFVGTNLVGHLVRSGWNVTVLHRPSSDLSVLGRFPVQRVVGDLVDGASVRAAMPAGVDAVFHVASDLSFQAAGDREQTRINVEGTRHMLEAARERGARRFVYTSTLGTYGAHEGIITEATPQLATQSTMNYARSKWQAEELVRAAARDGLHATVLNPAGILGPYDRTTWGAFFFLLRDGLMPYTPDRGTMTWCHVEDVVAAHLAAASHGARGAHYILGGAEADLHTVLEAMAGCLGIDHVARRLPNDLLMRYARLQSEIAAVLGSSTIYTPEVIEVFTVDYRCDDARARHDLGYHSRPLRDMVADSHAWLVAEGLL